MTARVHLSLPQGIARRLELPRHSALPKHEFSPQELEALSAVAQHKLIHVKSWSRASKDQRYVLLQLATSIPLFHSQEDITTDKAYPQTLKERSTLRKDPQAGPAMEEVLTYDTVLQRIDGCYEVPRTDLSTPSIKTDFDEDDVTLNKMRANLDFVQTIKDNLNASKTSLLYLDGHKTFYTTNALMLAGLQPSQLHITNPAFATLSDKDLQPKWWNNATMTQPLNLYAETMTERLMRLPRFHAHIPSTQQYSAGFDYCCRFEGNAEVKPMIDLQLLFSKQLLHTRGGVLWLTFSRRGSNTDATQAATQIIKEAKRANYTLELKHTNKYGIMYYLIFVSK